MILTRSLKDVFLIIACIFIPFLPLLYMLFPFSAKLWGFQIIGYGDWQVAIWTVGITMLPTLISGIALVYLPLKKINLLSFFLIVAFYTSAWQLWNAVFPFRDFNVYGISQFLAISTLLVSIILFFKLRKSRSEREKKEDLLRIIDQMTKEDLPQLFLEFANIGYFVDSINEPELTQSWRNVLKNQVTLGNEVVTATILKLEETKTHNL